MHGSLQLLRGSISPCQAGVRGAYNVAWHLQGTGFSSVLLGCNLGLQQLWCVVQVVRHVLWGAVGWADDMVFGWTAA